MENSKVQLPECTASESFERLLLYPRSVAVGKRSTSHVCGVDEDAIEAWI
jgi:hypothetical protein